ncbi:hypothetical protein [Rothia sp. ZJ932]|uniref:hypothetical protein n=1 Tax=Rothia sp. ZJ932 TaxID=2810516 RepID=UPI0019678995|nr:hypothetical protein [Rothia sp. ZJ932]QRZ61807.1 hypothetical protein JR346_01295 [Rothia sp. ZJ932]
MVKRRSREEFAETFLSGVEKDAPWKTQQAPSERSEEVASQTTAEQLADTPAPSALPQDAKQRLRARAKAGRKNGVYTIQATKSQKALMVHAADALDISQAKLLERYFFAPLEEEFGADVPFIEE